MPRRAFASITNRQSTCRTPSRTCEHSCLVQQKNKTRNKRSNETYERTTVGTDGLPRTIVIVAIVENCVRTESGCAVEIYSRDTLGIFAMIACARITQLEHTRA